MEDQIPDGSKNKALRQELNEAKLDLYEELDGLEARIEKIESCKAIQRLCQAESGNSETADPLGEGFARHSPVEYGAPNTLLPEEAHKTDMEVKDLRAEILPKLHNIDYGLDELNQRLNTPLKVHKDTVVAELHSCRNMARNLDTYTKPEGEPALSELVQRLQNLENSVRGST